MGQMLWGCLKNGVFVSLAAASILVVCSGKALSEEYPIDRYEKAQARFDEGRRLLKVKDYQGAILAIEEASKLLEAIRRDYPAWDMMVLVDMKASESEDIAALIKGSMEKEKKRAEEARAAIASPKGAEEEKRIKLEKQKKEEEAIALKEKEAAQAALKAKEEAKRKALRFSGRLSARYSNDTGNNTDNQKASEYLFMNVDNIIEERVSAYINMKSEQDLDGPGGNVYNYKVARSTLYSGYVDFYKLPFSTSLRAGRQYCYEAESAHFDGVRLDLVNPTRYSAAVFSGSPVTYYGTSYAKSLGGGFLRVTPNRNHTFESYLLDVVSGGNHDDGYGGSWQGRFFNSLNTRTNLTFLNSDTRDLNASATYNYSPWNASVTTAYYRQFLEVDTSQGSYSPYLVYLGSYIPFHQGRLSVAKNFSSKLNVSLGGLMRKAVKESSNSSNIEFNQYTANAFVSDLFFKDLSASMGVSRYDSTRNETTSLTGTLTKKFQKKLELSAGSYFSKYDYFFFAEGERIDTRTDFFKAIWKPVKIYTMHLNLSRQDTSNYSEPFYSLEARNDITF